MAICGISIKRNNLTWGEKDCKEKKKTWRKNKREKKKKKKLEKKKKQKPREPPIPPGVSDTQSAG